MSIEILWALIKRVPRGVWIALALAILVLALRAHWIGVGFDRGAADVQAKFDAYQAKVQAATDKALTAARRAESAQAGAIESVRLELRQDYEHARATQDRVIADLRAGRERLRQHWQGCPAAAARNVPEAAAGAAGTDAGAADRAESAGRIVRFAAECDAQVKALQNILTLERTP